MSATPISDAARASGGWNTAWDEAAAFDAEWMEKFLDMGTLPLRKGVLDPKMYEFLAIAVDASCTHLYSPGVRRHIGKALDLGATPEEIMAVLQAVAVLGIHSVALGAPILVDEMQKRGIEVPEVQP
ncbi:carboxymuconolactone decarboxylase family protein [Sphingorhabdus sp.]|jgi:alkylhydroperoxidase/carboxymuconolactone decarboxylase family protein YurZ|uniref:carboxymuconolactone decarboxylase family protein n=1 Tax=Sphingorhabdus sp. TaxID=1902408 RepID=UPI003BAE5986|nr:carboxymuconolactone decarboxylase family protein [Sphingomonadales bacterium]MBK9433303.1 carboxymuconolactone decarboxylase family protein [Sphingomonadales bacterium]